MNSLQKKKKKLNKTVQFIASAILEEIEEELDESKRIWVRKWVERRDTSGATKSLLKELELEDAKEYFATLRMSENCFNFLLTKVQPQIQRNDTNFRNAISTKTKLQTVVYFLATGCSLRTSTYLFRIGKSTISEFIPKVCIDIYESLKDYIQVIIK